MRQLTVEVSAVVNCRMNFGS